jgi:hypothetical protein
LSSWSWLGRGRISLVELFDFGDEFLKTENAHDTTHSKSPANAKRRALLSAAFSGLVPLSVGGSEDSGVSRVSRIERLPNAREPRGRTPPARRRARSPVSPRLTSARVSSRAVPPVQRTERRAGRGGAPLLSSSARGEPRLEPSEARSGGDARG